MKSVFLIALLAIICSGSASPAPVETRYNVLLISVDTLRADHLGAYGGKQKTPAFDRFAARSIVFENAISQAPLTLPSHATIFTGLFPPDHGIRNNEIFVLPQKLKTVAEAFKKQGYRTGAAVGSFALDSGFGLDQGFDWYEDQIQPSASGERYSERRAESVWQLGRAWIQKQSAPWFCFLHFYDPHTAYAPPKPYPQTYEGEVAYTDTIIGSVDEFLRKSNLYNTTIVVLFSDHGEGLGEHGEASHGVFLYDSVLRVPLMISAPGYNPSRVKSQVRLSDVAPTLLELAGLKPFTDLPAPSGTSLVPAMKGELVNLPAYSETYYTHLLMGWSPLYSIRTSNFKWIDAPKGELYNLTADAAEQNNLYSASSVPVELKREMEKHKSKQGNNSQDRSEAVDPELQERLASLGYVTGSSTVVKGGSNLDPKDGIAVWTKIEAAVTAAQMDRYQAAEQGLFTALKMQPDNVIAKKFLANVLAKQGKDEQAIQYLQDAMKSDLHREETRIDLAKLYYGNQRYTEVLDLLLPVTGIDSQNAVSVKLIGLASAHAQNYENAAKYLKRALDLYPRDPDCLSSYARILSYQKSDQEALKIYSRLESVRELTEKEAIQIAAIHLTLRNPDAAETYFQKAVQSNPTSTQSWEGLAIIYASRKDWAGAVTAFLNAGNCKGASQALKQLPDPDQKILDAYSNKCEK